MGLDEYFVRKGFPVYNVDQASRARSGFEVTVFNRVRQGRLPPSALPELGYTSFERIWQTFRFGPSFGVPWPDEKFPVEALAEFSKQGVPGLNALLEPPDSRGDDGSLMTDKVGSTTKVTKGKGERAIRQLI